LDIPKKTLSILVAGLLIMAVVLSGCGKKPKKDLYSVIKSRGKLIVGVKYDAKPFGYIDNGQEGEAVRGFDVDLSRELAKRILGNKNAVEFQQVTSSNRIFALTSGTVDMIAATLSMTPQRGRIIDFSTPYYIAGQAVLVPKDSDIKSISDLAGRVIIVVLGSTSEANIRQLLPKAKILGFRTYTDAFSALRNGRGDALTTDDTIIYGFIADNPDFVMLSERITQEPYVIGFKKGVEVQSLVETVNFTLSEMNEDGTLVRLKEKWVGNLKKDQEKKNEMEQGVSILRQGSVGLTTPCPADNVDKDVRD
jgi:putative glutamine transport system substrate-binding protein